MNTGETNSMTRIIEPGPPCLFTFTEVPDLDDARVEAEARNQRYRQ